jgi:hypothetical protein
MRFLVMVMATWLTGCSFAFVHGPPPRHREMPAFRCTASPALPIVDTVIGGGQVLSALVYAAISEQAWNDAYNGNPPFDRSVAVAVNAVTAALFFGSAIYGYSTTSDCRVARNQAAARLGPPPAAAPYPPGAPPYGPPGLSPPPPYAPPSVPPTVPPPAAPPGISP